MGRNPMSGHREKTINVFEEWRQLHNGMWQKFRTSFGPTPAAACASRKPLKFSSGMAQTTASTARLWNMRSWIVCSWACTVESPPVRTTCATSALPSERLNRSRRLFVITTVPLMPSLPARGVPDRRRVGTFLGRHRHVW